MSNSIARTASNLPATNDLMAGLKNTQAIGQSDGSVSQGSFMSFTKGVYSFGVDGIEPEEGLKWAVNPQSVTTGYQCWGNPRELLGEEVSGFGQPGIAKASLQAHTYTVKKGPDKGSERKAEWVPLRGFQLVCVEGEFEGTQCYFAKTSKGFLRAVGDLIDAVVEQMQDDSSKPVPLILLENESYDHKEFGEIFNPVFEIVGWTDMDSTTIDDALDDDEDDDDESEDDDTPKVVNGEIQEDFIDGMEDDEGEEPEVKPRRRKKKVEEPAKKEEPSGRRRRRRAAE